MHTPHRSYFKNQVQAEVFFDNWVRRIEAQNQCTYQRQEVATILGKTVVWSLNADRHDWPALVIFPGFRTCGLFWDLDNNLAPLKASHRIFLVDVNGQPCLSDGFTPDVKSLGYGEWAADLFDKLALDTAIVAGASFGSLLGIKLAQVAPQRISKLVLMNPGCLQPFSLAPKNLYYNLLPLAWPTEGNVRKFLKEAVFYQDKHQLSGSAMQLLVDYELFAIKQFKDSTQKPYAMPMEELASVQVPVYLLLGDKDILFPCQKSVDAAKKGFKHLRKIQVLPNIGHGIETSPAAIAALASLIQEESCLTGVGVF
jgi:pimeloyl-ACP methyl ester carboxylesterase